MGVEKRVGLLVASSILAGSQKHSFQLTNQVTVQTQTPRKRNPLNWVVKKKKRNIFILFRLVGNN